MNLRATLGSMFAPLLIHNLNESMAKIRADGGPVTRPAAGTVYPGSQVDTTIHNNTGWLKGAILGTALAATGIGAGLALPGLVGKQPVAAPTPPAPITAVGPVSPTPDSLNPWDEIQIDQSGNEIPGTRKPFGKFPRDWTPTNGGVIP